MSIKTVILAAGKGTRMRSNKAKVLHEIAGKPMLLRVVEAAKSLDSEVAIVYGHDGEQVKKSLSGLSATWVEQAEQLGTGHAIQQAINFIDDEDTVLILYGDVPLIKNSTLEAMVETIDADAMSLLTVHLDNPTGYGRIVRFDGMIQRIVEQKDASSSELSIKEVNTGIMALYGASLKKWLSSLQNNNSQEEYYLTDIIEMAVCDGVAIRAVHPANEYEVQGINSKSQLNELERYYQRTNAQELMNQGVTLADANRIDVRGNLIIKGVDSYIDVNAVFEGNVEIGEGVKIGANCVITDAIIKDNVIIKPNSVLESCT
ncbi:MAG: bifunctional UDP-N-acetylglucosamine diphosphorylase/glucosamine-1-phosphate N-acetyltransferase GlmU, partial [Cycloclasticus sp.]|nr:bifunctional UDP-N-acetylglucosamine diphosphorylase/glucosamine-1-phosphate N-acetyltransferase GlmU [Cycloclasticus sp.]